MLCNHQSPQPRVAVPVLSGVPQDDGEDKDEVPRRLYYAHAHQVTNIKIVFTGNDLKPEHSQRSFKPDLTHQIFGNSGIVYGYRNLSIDIYYLANSARCFVELKHTEIVNTENGEQMPPDDIFKNLAAWLPEGYCTDKRKFLHAISNECHRKMFGKPVAVYQTFNKQEETQYKYTVTLCSSAEPGFAEFHSRFQCLLVWYIDAASQIDVDDPNWMFLYVYEQRRQPNGSPGAKYPVGFCTVYKFFHFPDKIRARISQLFIIPPCQHTGLGTVLLRQTYKAIQSLPNVIDITVEDPCPTFTKMRDMLDCQLLMQLECFKSPHIRGGFTREMFEEANSQFKLNKKQCRRVHDILRLAYLKQSDDSMQAYNSFYSEVVHRLQAPFMREKKAIMRKKFSKEYLQGGDSVYQSSRPPRNGNIMSYLTEIGVVARRVESVLRQHN